MAPQARLLRVYWYDGLRGNGVQTEEQRDFAASQLTKVRLGVVNSRGEQKEVASLIVTDLIELARNRAISDALILSGDADIRVGMQIAQTFGVQVHLLGVKPAAGSQSPPLIHEADTHHEWSEEVISAFLSVQDEGPQQLRISLSNAASTSGPIAFEDAVARVVREGLASLDAKTRKEVSEDFRQEPHKVPARIDRPVLGTLKQLLNRELDEEERRRLREHLKDNLRSLS